MSLSVLARAQLPRRVLARSIHSTSPARSTHGDYHHLPFSIEKKGAFGAKLAAYLITGFSIPIIASVYQLKKAGGAA